MTGKSEGKKRKEGDLKVNSHGKRNLVCKSINYAYIKSELRHKKVISPINCLVTATIYFNYVSGIKKEANYEGKKKTNYERTSRHYR